MAATLSPTLSVRSTTSAGPRVGLFSQSQASRVNINSKSYFWNFNGLKATKSTNSASQSSFLGIESNAFLKSLNIAKAQSYNQRSYAYAPPRASYKVAVLGAAGGIGQPLSLLIKTSPLVSELNLYDVANVKGVSADLSHCNTPSLVSAFTGPSELANCLKGANTSKCKRP